MRNYLRFLLIKSKISKLILKNEVNGFYYLFIYLLHAIKILFHW